MGMQVSEEGNVSRWVIVGVVFGWDLDVGEKVGELFLRVC